MVRLESSKLFSHLPAKDLQELQEVARELKFQPGQHIFEVGDPGDGVYVVQEGVVAISGILTSGTREIFSHVLAGDFFGEMAVLDDLPRSAAAEAEKETIVYFIPREHMVSMLKHSPDLALTLIQETSYRLREFNQQYMDTVLRAERMALVGRFASSIVHDLKNPLTIIGMSAETSCMEEATPQMREVALERITRQVDRITHMVNDILDFVRGSQTSEIATLVNYREFLELLFQEIQRDVLQDKATIRLENQPPAVKLPMNARRIGRVFFNLIGNAADAIRVPGTISIGFEESDSEVITRIVDSGPGIPKIILDSLFDAFVTHGKSHGTGLGLSICKRIIDEHQGRISARNAPAGGAEFTIALPKNRS